MDSSIAPYLDFLTRVLTPGRLKHSLGVMQMMADFSEVYGLDREKAILAGLLHDAAKDLPPAQQAQIIAEAGIPVRSPWDHDYVLYMHGPVGACFVQRELGIDDPILLDAIWMHTFCGEGERFDLPLVWCLRFSDILEPSRSWNQFAHFIRDGEPRLRRLALGGQLAQAAFYHTGLLIRSYEEWGNIIHPNIRKIYQEYSARLGLDESWFEFRVWQISICSNEINSNGYFEGPNPPAPFPMREGGLSRANHVDIEYRECQNHVKAPLPVSGRGRGLGETSGIQGWFSEN